jgi:hypothetical protein
MKRLIKEMEHSEGAGDLSLGETGGVFQRVDGCPQTVIPDFFILSAPKFKKRRLPKNQIIHIRKAKSGRRGRRQRTLRRKPTTIFKIIIFSNLAQIRV